MKINNLNEKETAVIKECNNKHLLQHGFTPNTNIYVYKKFSNIMCFLIRGAIIAVRNSDCESIEV
jgi:Fe2+ transport system protein FeoA